MIGEEIFQHLDDMVMYLGNMTTIAENSEHENLTEEECEQVRHNIELVKLTLGAMEEVMPRAQYYDPDRENKLMRIEREVERIASQSDVG